MPITLLPVHNTTDFLQLGFDPGIFFHFSKSGRISMPLRIVAHSLENSLHFSNCAPIPLHNDTNYIISSNFYVAE